MFDYYRPAEVERIVVPYHPLVMLLWGAHMNIGCYAAGMVFVSVEVRHEFRTKR
jgi:hypothetical protein